MKRNTTDEARLQRIQIAALINDGTGSREIQRQLGCSFSTISKVKKMMDDPQRSVSDDQREENGRPNHYTAETKDAIFKMREETGFGARLIWAMIQRRPELYGLSKDQIPSTHLIAEWFAEKGLTRKMVGAKDRRGFPIDFEDKPGVIAMDEWGPYHLRASRLFMVTAQDRFTRLAFGVPVWKKGSINTWIRTIDLASEHTLNGAAPTALWIDNGIGMSLASGHTSQPVRHALSLGTRVVFNAPHTPWKNGKLENWHWRQETEYWSRIDPQISEKEAISGFLSYVNWYNVERPHGGLRDLDGTKVQNHAPADLASWFLPFTLDDIAQRGNETGERYDAQSGIIDMIRMVRNNGELDLQEGERMRVSEIFGGAWLRIRFHLDPKAPQQIGEVIWQRGQQKEALTIATFNHEIDRSRSRSAPLVHSVRDVDFSDSPEAEYIMGKPQTALDEHQFDRAAQRIGKRGHRKNK